MNHKAKIPFYYIKLRHSDAFIANIPLADTKAIQVNSTSKQIITKGKRALEKKVTESFEFDWMLDWPSKDDFHKDKVLLSLPKSKDDISYPVIDMEFEYFYQERGNAYWAFIPALNLEVGTQDFEILKPTISHFLRTALLKNSRFRYAQDILETQWFLASEIERKDIDIAIPNLKTLWEKKQSEKSNILEKIARPASIGATEVFERESYLQQLEKILLTTHSNNTLLLGTPGSGKSAIIKFVAQKLEKKKKNFKIWETTAATLIKELTIGDKGWKTNFQSFVQEVAQKQGKHILFITKFTELFEVGRSVGNNVSLGEYMKTAIQKGQMTVVSELTKNELAQIELKHPGIIQLFNIVRIPDQKNEALTKCVQDTVKNKAAQLGIQLANEGIAEIVSHFKRFSPYEGLPAKPILFFDQLLHDAYALGKKNLDFGYIIEHFCFQTGIPDFILNPKIPFKQEKTKQYFANRIYGQKEAVDTIAGTLPAIKAGLNRMDKPIASFLFAGPTGVGKTELVKALANYIFGSEERMVRFDMSEYSNAYALGKLDGSATDGEGLFAKTIRKEPFSILLFDEIEKAYPKFFDYLLQILGEGRFTNATGQYINFCSTIIIMTSNIGADKFKRINIGYGDQSNQNDIKATFLQAARDTFRPELFNRIDKIVAFAPLTESWMKQIIEREIHLILGRKGILNRNIKLQIAPEIVDYFYHKPIDKRFGAREIKRLLNEHLTIPLAKALNAEDIEEHLIINFFIQENDFIIDIQKDDESTKRLFNKWENSNYAGMISKQRRAMVNLLDSFNITELKHELKHLKKHQPFDKKIFIISDLIKRLEESKNDIHQIEDEVDAAFLKREWFDKHTIIDKYQQWQKIQFQLIHEIIAFIDPSLNESRMIIWGDMPVDILPYIIEHLYENNLSVIASYSILTAKNNQNIIQDKNVKATVEKLKLSDKFSLQVINEHHPSDIKKLHKDTQGIILHIKGNLAYWYASIFSKLIEWRINPQVKYFYQIQNLKINDVPRWPVKLKFSDREKSELKANLIIQSNDRKNDIVLEKPDIEVNLNDWLTEESKASIEQKIEAFFNF